MGIKDEDIPDSSMMPTDEGILNRSMMPAGPKLHAKIKSQKTMSNKETLETARYQGANHP